MKNNTATATKSLDIGHFINRLQTLFVGLLRVWSIPIVLMLSLASGFTTFYGLSNFILPWIALVITIAIQSIIVICSLELAGMHWRANRLRYLTVVLSLLVALLASVSFSYFKFYEISEQDTLHIKKLNQLKGGIKQYVDDILVIKNLTLVAQNKVLEKAAEEVSQAYFGTHPQVAPDFKNHVGEGRFWRHYNQLYKEKKHTLEKFEQDFKVLDTSIRNVQVSLNELDVSNKPEQAYQTFMTHFQEVQSKVNQLPNLSNQPLPSAPLLMTYSQFAQTVKPSFDMWSGFSLFAFICAAMVDFFTVLLSYRLEFNAPGPLTKDEENLVFECLREFTQFKINANDELQIVIEKTPLEKARHYSDWSRMFAVGLLLNRGFLRKIDDRTVEFSPNLYPLISDKMGEKLRQRQQAAIKTVHS
ncbi:MAG: hypothetical protein HOP02_01655 [Methylococcaceae bacterium]|nr:hypothetical protein [Methylococcaceae bacterium]